MSLNTHIFVICKDNLFIFLQVLTTARYFFLCKYLTFDFYCQKVPSVRSWLIYISIQRQSTDAYVNTYRRDTLQSVNIVGKDFTEKKFEKSSDHTYVANIDLICK